MILDHAAVLPELIARNERFVADKLDGKLQDSSRKQELVKGQNPFAIILSCADSRVVPEFAFDSGLGELFVIRVAGNIANASSLASIEYAVAHLGVQLIMVLGHQSCGAVTAAIAGGDNGPNLNHLVAHITPAVEAAESNEVDVVVRKNAQMTADELLAKSDILKGAHADGKLRIVPAFYELGTGRVNILD